MGDINKNDLDNYITGHYGEDQFRGEKSMIPANTIVTCPSCETEFTVEFDVQEDEVLECENCNAELFLEDGDLHPLSESEDISVDDDEDEDDDDIATPPQRPVGRKAS